MEFNPSTIEAQYSLQMAGYLVHQFQPASVLVCTDDLEIALAAVQRLAWVGDGLFVEHEKIQDYIKKTLGRQVFQINKSQDLDVALVLFSRKQYPRPPIARRLVLVDHNALSYKSLIYPGQVRDHVIAQIGWLRREYALEQHIGLFGPGFIAPWALSTAAGSRSSPVHFLSGQRAMERIFTASPLWWLGYVTILSGRLKDEGRGNCLYSVL